MTMTIELVVVIVMAIIFGTGGRGGAAGDNDGSDGAGWWCVDNLTMLVVAWMLKK